MNDDIDCRIVKETAFGVYYAVNLTELFIELFNPRKMYQNNKHTNLVCPPLIGFRKKLLIQNKKTH